MPILRRLLINAAARVATDPELRAKAADVFARQVKPRAQAALREARPRLEAVRDDLREIATEADPRDNPRDFARRVKRRFFDREERE